MNTNRLLALTLSFLFFSCSSSQKEISKVTKTYRASVIPFINQEYPKDKSFGNIITAAVISSLSFSEKFRYVDEEFEKYYIYNSLQLAQSIGDEALEKFLKEIMQIQGKENPGIDVFISGYYFQKDYRTFIHVKILYANGMHSEFEIQPDQNFIAQVKALSNRILYSLESENTKALENLEMSFALTQNEEAFKLYLEGKAEKRKKTIYGYMNAIRKFQASQQKDGLYLLPLNEIIHTLTQISSDLLELIKAEKIINDSKIMTGAKVQLKRNADILQNAIHIYNSAKKERPGEYEKISAIYEKSPFKKQYEWKASLFKNQIEYLMLRWEDEKFQRESIVKGQIKSINSGYTPLLVTEFFQTLTGSNININDILRALLQYSKDHPENRYLIHYFKNFTRLMKTMNEFDYMKLNPESNFSYYQLHQEYIFYVHEYLNVMREGL